MKDIECRECGALNSPSYKHCYKCGHIFRFRSSVRPEAIAQRQAEQEQSQAEPEQSSSRLVIGTVYAVVVAVVAAALFLRFGDSGDTQPPPTTVVAAPATTTASQPRTTTTRQPSAIEGYRSFVEIRVKNTSYEGDIYMPALVAVGQAICEDLASGMSRDETFDWWESRQYVGDPALDKDIPKVMNAVFNGATKYFCPSWDG